MEMEETNRFFAEEKPLRLFLTVAVPGLISMLAMSLYLAFEGGFVGHMVGQAALAAVNIGMPLVMINNSLADLVGVGSSAPISVALGRQDTQKANNIFTCSVLLIFLMSLVMGVVIFFVCPYFVGLMGAQGELAELAVRYIRVYALMGPVTTIVFAMDNYLRISGFIKGSMFLNIFMTILTVGLLALFLGAMDMSVEGSALASTLSMAVCAVIAMVPFVRKKALLKFVKPKFSMGMIREIVSCGMPTFLNNVAGRVTAIFMNAALIREGGQTAVAAYSVLMYASGVVEPMLYGMSDSVQPAIGYNWGAGSLKRVAGITKVSFVICGLVSIACAGVMFVIPEPIVSIFVNRAKEPELYAMAIGAMPYMGLSFLFGWFCFAIQGFFAAVERPLYATIVSVTFAFITPLGLLWALQPWGLTGLWLNSFGRALLTGLTGVVFLVMAQKRMQRDIEKYRKAEA